MPDVATRPPSRRPELVVRRLGDRGPYVVKEPLSGGYYQLGEEEHFLLEQLDGWRDSEVIRGAFAERFGQPLADEELHQFLETARTQGLLQDQGPPSLEPRRPGGEPADPEARVGSPPIGWRLLYWRKSLFDPDPLFTWLAPRIWFFWTPTFLVLSTISIVAASLLLWVNRQGLTGSLLNALHWETAILTWVVLLLVTACHEFAHGLTCKRHGGEVHEIGFLLIFFMPCCYCNVSDAWLFREKSKRLSVTLAGSYIELFLWALAVFVWRLTMPDSLVNRLSFLVLTACGVQTLSNFNPLLKLDGYYLLSDWLEVPNLHQRAGDFLQAHLRSLLWGAPRPEPEPCGRLLLIYALASWLYSLAFLGITLFVMGKVMGARLGALGIAAVALLLFLSVGGLFRGLFAGEITTMLRVRPKHTARWTLIVALVSALLYFVEIEDRVGAAFRLRSATLAEIRAPVASFIRAVHFDEGHWISEQAVVVQLDVPDLPNRIAQKQAEVRETEARVRLLEAGARKEDVQQQRLRVQRAEAWRDLARRDLARAGEAHKEVLIRLEKQIVQYRAEWESSESALRRTEKLRKRDAVSGEEYAEAETRSRVAQARHEQTRAQLRERQALGTQEAEAELARREKELADARATLALLEAGTRPEEIQAERARLSRLQGDVRYLESVQGRLPVRSPVAGELCTSHLKEKIGQYVQEGDLICVVEYAAVLVAEVALAEQDVERVCVGQPVKLKARALPFCTFWSRVERIAPSAGRGDVQSTVTLSCRLTNPGSRLRPGMTGHARVFTCRQALGQALLDRALRYLRTEFWW